MKRKRLFIVFLYVAFIANLSAESLAQNKWPNHWVPQFDENGIDSNWALTLENKLLWGYIDRKGNFLIHPIYDKADSFWHECAEVRKDGKNFYIDHKGNETTNWQCFSYASASK